MTSIPVFWNGTIVDFVTPEDAEKAIKNNPDARLITYKGNSGQMHEGLLITTPKPNWRSIPV